jgi:hypothetical protein
MPSPSTSRVALYVAAIALSACATESGAGAPEVIASTIVPTSAGNAEVGPAGSSSEAGEVEGSSNAPCDGPACGCASGLERCNESALSGSTDAVRCVDLASDASHCGACGKLCAPEQACVAGQCASDCPMGLTLCGATCVDVSSDASNCGACGRACGAGICSAGVCPAGKDCALTTSVTAPTLADFETYVSGTSADTFSFSFNGPPGSPLSVSSGSYQYSDGTGAQSLAMVPGDGSGYAASISNELASAWGGALGLWMGCIDASSFDGLAFSVRGQVPGGTATVTTLTEGTSAPSATDPAAGGTCLDGCAPATASFPVNAEYRRVLLPWSSFTAGTANGQSLPLTGGGITGLTFSVALDWAEVASGAGTYGPVASGYELALDDVGFFRTSELCAAGQEVCDSTCVDLLSDPAHCGACGVPCGGGSTCAGAAGCVCSDGRTFCAGACVDLGSDESHCGACGNFCSIGAACQQGQCSGGPATTSQRCGETTRLLGNPLGCDFGWGANPDGAIPGFVDFASRWVGYEPNIDARCDGCDWLRGFAGSTAIPTYIAYFAAYRANIEAGLGDCNLDFDGNNLCTGGAQWIRQNRGRLLDIYASYAARSYAVIADRPVLWIVEPDFSQYAEPSQSNPLSMQELGQLASDILCAIKGNMPNAVIALNHSTWLGGAELTGFWNAMPLDLIDLLHITSVADVPGGYFNTGDANSRQDGTFRFLRQLTGKPIIADTSFGVTTMQDSWSTASAATLNARITDGVVGALIYPTPGDYAQRIGGLAPQLASTCP